MIVIFKYDKTSGDLYNSGQPTKGANHCLCYKEVSAVLPGDSIIAETKNKINSHF
ncbi:MAG: hypothetical protein JETCAE03_09810 [Ignavibacteriaceae bacterium]|nr:MAG: hypothetical protein BroJett017_11920 [Ignavibacteriota bacterium]GJQ41483.1 MAG: hypothetical protein JETCAE03_09810 [Ignavibacteriaceae bacterium]